MKFLVRLPFSLHVFVSEVPVHCADACVAPCAWHLCEGHACTTAVMDTAGHTQMGGNVGSHVVPCQARVHACLCPCSCVT